MKKNHGGPRPGAGRKPASDPRVALQIRLPRELVVWLDNQPGSRTSVIERIISDYKNQERS